MIPLRSEKLSRVLLITAPQAAKGSHAALDGKTFGIFVSIRSIKVVDTHNHELFHCRRRGTIVASTQGGGAAEAAAVADWVFRSGGLLDGMNCSCVASCPVEVVVVSPTHEGASVARASADESAEVSAVANETKGLSSPPFRPPGQAGAVAVDSASRDGGDAEVVSASTKDSATRDVRVRMDPRDM